MADCSATGALSHQGTVLRNLEIAPGCVRLEISCPAVSAAVKPGQFVMLRAREGMDPFLSRAFSVCDLLRGDGPKAPPTGFVVLIQVVGVGTKALAERQSGEAIGVLGPLGKPYDLGTPAEHMVMVAGGIGAAPFLLVAVCCWFVPNTVSYTAGQFLGWTHGRFAAGRTWPIADGTVMKLASGLMVGGMTTIAGTIWLTVTATLFVWLPGLVRARRTAR